MKKQGKYADIIGLSRPSVPKEHPRMDIQNRAKIFSPFAALRGYDGKIEEENWKKARVRKHGISDEDLEILAEKLNVLHKGMQVRISYFKPDLADFEESYPLGTCEEISGTVIDVDLIFGKLKLRALNNISFEKDGLTKDAALEIQLEDIITITEETGGL